MVSVRKGSLTLNNLRWEQSPHMLRELERERRERARRQRAYIAFWLSVANLILSVYTLALLTAKMGWFK